MKNYETISHNFDTHILTHATSEGKVLQREIIEKGTKATLYKKQA